MGARFFSGAETKQPTGGPVRNRAFRSQPVTRKVQPLTLANTGTLAVGDYVCVYQNKDTVAIDDKGLDYLGEDSGPDPHVWAQYTKITNISGNVITIDPALYQVTPSPTGRKILCENRRSESREPGLRTCD